MLAQFKIWTFTLNLLSLLTRIASNAAEVGCPRHMRVG